jgi:ABC-type multidrug transport system ATPase subunit
LINGRLGYCPLGLLQEELTIEENMQVMGGLKGLQPKYIVRYMLKMLRYFRLKGLENVRVKHLSDAQKKKVSIAAALIGFPKVLLFDEITDGVDVDGRRKMMTLLKAYSE